MPHQTYIDPLIRVVNSNSQNDSSKRKMIVPSAGRMMYHQQQHHQHSEEPQIQVQQNHQTPLHRPITLHQNFSSNASEGTPLQTSIMMNQIKNLKCYRDNDCNVNTNAGGSATIAYTNHINQTKGGNFGTIVNSDTNFQMMIRQQQLQHLMRQSIIHQTSSLLPPVVMSQPFPSNAVSERYESSDQYNPFLRPKTMISSVHDYNQPFQGQHKRLRSDFECSNYEHFPQKKSVFDAPTIVLRPNGEISNTYELSNNNFCYINNPMFVERRQHHSFDIVERGAHSDTVRDHGNMMEAPADPFGEFRRPLTAYNFFVSAETDLILKILNRAEKILVNNVKTTSFDTSPTATTTTNTNTTTCTTQQAEETESSVELTPLKTSSTHSNGASIDKEVAYFQKIISETPFSDKELAEHDKSAVVKAQLLLDVHMEADRIKKPHRKQHGKISFKTLGKLIGLRWRDCDPERKAIYFDLAQKDMDRYKSQARRVAPYCHSLPNW